MYRIDEQLKEFIESGVAVILGTADEAGRPEVSYVWGPRANAGDGSISLFLEEARSGRTLANAHATRRLAVTFADPVSYHSIQLKGTFTGVCAPDAEEDEWVQRHREAFATSTALVGDPQYGRRNYWMEGVLRIDMSVECAFDQTPGPNAGAPL